MSYYRTALLCATVRQISIRLLFVGQLHSTAYISQPGQLFRAFTSYIFDSFHTFPFPFIIHTSMFPFFQFRFPEFHPEIPVSLHFCVPSQPLRS